MSENPLLQKIRLPGRIFQLPSRGLFYNNGELESTVKDGEIHVHAMSAFAEIHMKNPDQLFSGQAVDTVFRECVRGVLEPTKLLAKDVDAVLMFLRTVTYGPNYEFTAKHTCKDAKDHSYIADVDQMIAGMKMIDPTVVHEMFLCELDNGQRVKLRPSTYEQIINILKSNEGKKEITVDDMKSNLMSMLTSVVVQVDDVTDRLFIAEWLSKLRAPDVNKIAQRVEDINEWGPNLKWTTKCRDCGEDFTVELPINPVSFFTE